MSVSNTTRDESDLRHKLAEIHVTVLAGGVGGAKIADGIAQHVSPENLSIVVNTGDDFDHLGLRICPDLDTVMYLLAGVANSETGWGRSGESWRAMEEVKRLGGPDWFALGDLDLGTHLIRTHLLADGLSLSGVTHHLCDVFGIGVDLLPMSDQPAPTLIDTDEGQLPFQTWFVEQQWQPAVKEILFPHDVRATTQVVNALSNTHILVVAPSNPFVSIDPILNVYPIREMVTDLPAMVVAISPIIAGKAVKGPAAKMMQEMGMPATSSAVASYYDGLIDLFVSDVRDEDSPDQSDLLTMQTDTLMVDQGDRSRLAREILTFCMEHIE
ncbi:MAG: 2-phospho-L-lactate transferase [Candidatus Promineifilaceae bacterium]